MRNQDMPLLHNRTHTPQLAQLQTTVLSTFARDPYYSHQSNNVAKRRKHDSPKPKLLNNLCDDLCCISTDSGLSNISQLKQKLQNRSYSSAHLATHLFMCDQVDTGPPLCAAVHMLQARLIHLKDVPPAVMIDRAILELRIPQSCSCRGQRNGIQAIIRFILQDSRSSERDTFVHHFLMVLFPHTEAQSPIPQKKERFRLAEHVLSAIRERQQHDDEQDTSKLHEWVRHASLPTRAATEHRTESNSDIWTAELSGLATGRSPWEYLTYGKAEERALINLFKVLPPLNASRVYLECIHSIFSHTTISSKLPPRAIGSWSRVVFLGRRVLDTTGFSDADPALRRGIQSSLNGVLTAAVSLNEYHDVAVLLCLIRCILVPAGSLEEGSSSSKDLKEYEIWLREFVERSHGTAVVTLLKTLTELIPLEPLKLLRVNLKVLSLKRENASLAADYLTSLRARISDLDPARSELFLNSQHKGFGRSGPQLDNPDRIEEEVMHFVLEYTKLKKIPSSLVRKMNFHRYYFRTRILQSLFDPSLGNKFREKPFNQQLINACSFDECRIDMIKELAFNRKDKAITVAEANEAIASIRATKHPTETVKDPKHLDENAGTSVVKESNSVKEICIAIFQECRVRSTSSSATHVTTTADNLTSVGVLVKKIEGKWNSGEDPARGPELAAELLHGMMGALEESGRSRYPEIFVYLFDSTADSALTVYAAWWNSYGFGLLQAMRHLLDNPAGRKMQRFIQYQLFALLCAGEVCLTEGSVISLAIFATGLAKVGGTSALMDILMISKGSSECSFNDFLSILISCLPLTQADSVKTSTTFALHCVCLYVTLFESTGTHKQKQTDNSAYVKNHMGSFAESRAYRSMLDLLRWVICHPWRLSAFPSRECFPSREKVMGDAISVITFITRLLVSRKIPISHDFTIEQYIHIEERCGWGRVGSVYEELRKREISGIHPTRLLCQFALFVAKRSSSRWPSVAWMEQGMMRYAEETISCRALENINHMTSCDAPRFLEDSVNSGGTDVGLQLLELYSRMRFCYFHGYSGVEIEQHLTTTLVPWYWPFSPLFVDYLWDCLNKRCSSWEIDRCGIKDNFLLLSNFALHDSFRRDHVSEVSGQHGTSFKAGTHSNDLISRRTELRKAMEELSAFECGMNGDLGTQVITRTVSRSCLPATLAKAFGSCVVLGLAKKCQLLERGLRAERVRAWLGQVGTIVDEASVSDFLGTSISVASLLPFTRLAEEYERRDQVTEITNDILTELLERHVPLLGEGTPPFHWTRRLLSGSVVCGDDMRTNFIMWSGLHVGNNMSQSKYPLFSLPVDVCMARLFQSVGSLCDESLCCTISNVGHDGLSKCLIPNILNTCRRLPSYGSRTADVKLSKFSYESLLERRVVLVREMITVVIRLLTSARETLANFGDRDIDKVVASYPEFREEVISGVAAKMTKLN